jgi:site-specific DNA-methyltransferase (adenine-specific)
VARVTWEIRQGDCLGLLREMPAGSVDAVVCDPPYGLSFMGKEWDHGVPGEPFWAEALRVAKPGAHLLAFGGTRTYHRLTCAVEDAGWEIRDCLSWLYGSGFPKSLDVSKAIDKAAGAEREVVGKREYADGTVGSWRSSTSDKYAQDEWTQDESNRPKMDTAPATDAAREWSGWGTALKPAWEPVILARKPLAGTVAANVLAHGTGALNVDGCRIEADGRPLRLLDESRTVERGTYNAAGDGSLSSSSRGMGTTNLGRWPANVLLDEDAAAALDEQSGETKDGAAGTRRAENNVYSPLGTRDTPWGTYGGSGGASRFFYTAKAASGERHYAGRNGHPTVKPVDLMRWLCRLVTPPGGLVLDPFCGSGSTGVAALAEGFRFIGMEQDAEWCAVARRRIAGPLFAGQETPA